MKVLFSSWNGQVVDNRGRSPESWADVPNLKLPEVFDQENKITAFMGWGGIIVLRGPFNVVAMARDYMKSVQKESCGRCFPCRVGTAVLLTSLDNLMAGTGTSEDLSKLTSLGDEIIATSKCTIGQTGPLPVIHAVQHFRDEFERAVQEKKEIESGATYVSKWTAPCYAACPTGMNIPTYIELIKEGDYAGSLESIRSCAPFASSLGRACFNPCEKSCRRENVERAISICRLKRFAFDYEDQHMVKKPENPNRHTRSEKVAIIGGGPAGLSTAYYLALYGYPVTVFEALAVPGGMAYVGIPAYRIPKDLLQKEVDHIEAMGVEVKYNVRVGKDITIPQIREQGYKAVFIGQGAHISKKMGVEGEDQDYDGFLRGIDFLRDLLITGKSTVEGKRVLVVGGGNVAMDCARSPIRAGASEVTVVYRRTKKELPADPHEIHDSEAEGVKYAFLVAPKRIVAENGKVVGLECAKMELGPPDDSGRRRPVPIKDSDYVIPCDVIIQAIGQDCDLSPLSGVEDVKINKWDNIEADADTLQTDVEWLFTGGDVFTGPLSLVDSCGNGRRAAESMHQYLQGEKPSLSNDEKMDKVMKKLGVYNADEKVGRIGGWERNPMPELPVAERTDSFIEVQTGLTLKTATDEASRCMRCYYVGMVALEKNGEN
ncbi:MAG: FAD-dependent oxidoreductase [Nitrospinota bacterium]